MQKEGSQNQPPNPQHDLDIFKRHHDLFDLFTRGRFEVRPPEPGMTTFCVNLKPMATGEKAVVYASPAFYEKTGASGEKAVNSFLHELNHISEIVELLGEDDGLAVWESDTLRRAQNRRIGILDNVQDDIRMDSAIVEKAPAQTEIQEKIYREDLYPSGDYSKLPRHLQFIYSLFRESKMPDEECVVAPEVRAHLEKLKQMKGKNGRSFWDFHASTAIAPSLRIKLREKFLEPIVEELYQLDLADEQKKREEEKEKRKKDKQGQKEKGEAGESGESGESSKPGEQKPAEDPQSSQPGEQQPTQPGGQPSEPKVGASESSGSGEPIPDELPTPEEYFNKLYDEFDAKRPHTVFNPEDLKKAIEEAVKAIEVEKNKTPEQKAMDAYAKAEGVSVEQLETYQKFYEELEKIENPVTGETVLEELRAIFRQIITDRSEQKEVPHYPRDEGELLYDPAGAVADTKAGQRDPTVWMTYETATEVQEKCGEFDVTILGDRSVSMKKGGKSIEQRKAMMLLVEALREFSEDLEENKMKMVDELNVRTEVRSFGDAKSNELLKPLGSELTEKQRALCYQKLADVSGSATQDYAVLKEFLENIPAEDLDKIKEKKLRKIVIVLTDGGSSNEPELQVILNKIRSSGITVVGVGITQSGEPVVNAYAPNGQVCPDASTLGVVLGSLLKDFLKGV